MRITFCFTYSSCAPLWILGREASQVPDMVVMIAHGDREDLLGFVLLDHEAIEVSFDIAGR
jgi:hypothetical protein